MTFVELWNWVNENAAVFGVIIAAAGLIGGGGYAIYKKQTYTQNISNSSIGTNVQGEQYNVSSPPASKSEKFGEEIEK